MDDITRVKSAHLGPMMVASFGTSTPFSYWGFVWLCKMVGFLTGDFLRIHGTTLLDLRDGWLNRTGRSVVFTTDLPEATLCDFLLGNEIPIVVFLDDPQDAVISAIASRGLSVEQAIRFSTRTFCAMSEPFKSSRTLVIRRWEHTEIRDIASLILRYLGGGDQEDEVDAVLEFCIEGYDADKSTKLEDELAERGIRGALFGDQTLDLSKNAKALIQRAVAGYRPIFDGHELSDITWPNELFIAAGELPASAPVELAGPSRTLIWGPYMYLPRGQWEAKIVFEVVDVFSDHQAVVDVRMNEVIVEKIMVMPRIGMYSYTLLFEVDDANKSVELRILMKTGAIEGRFLLRSVSLAPASEVDPAATKIANDVTRGDDDLAPSPDQLDAEVVAQIKNAATRSSGKSTPSRTRLRLPRASIPSWLNK
jgi:hypothetical protein